ncbi:MAG: threonylcarbamoyl-AMP synthase [Nitrospirae bacterium]|nr:threonylcarbamoyl-AMP synthase [Nitrospirota bacterium]
MRIIKISQTSPDPSAVSEIAELLRAGSVIAYPTDTFYGLGADITNQSAIRRLYSIKNRQPDKPILILISDMQMLHPLIAGGYLPPIARRLTDSFWPGPLTLVFHASEKVPALLTANTGKVGIRLPDNELCKLLIAKLEHPLTATSANISGVRSIYNPDEIIETIGSRIDALVDGGKTKGGLESTVVDVTGDKPEIIREGAIPRSLIKEGISR